MTRTKVIVVSVGLLLCLALGVAKTWPVRQPVLVTPVAATAPALATNPIPALPPRVVGVTTRDMDNDCKSVETVTEVDLNHTALLLMDVWETDIPLWQQVIDAKIIPLIDACRKAHVPVIHLSHGRPEAKGVTLQDGELVLVDRVTCFVELHEHLDKHEITHLIYAGFASNMCVLHSPDGVVLSYIRKKKCILARDAMAAWINPGNDVDPEKVNEVTVRSTEFTFGSSVLTQDFIAALAGSTASQKQDAQP